MLVELTNELGQTAHVWKTLRSLRVDGSKSNPGSDVTSCVKGSAWCWTLYKPSEKGSVVIIFLVWCLLVHCYLLLKDFHDSATLKAWNGPTRWLASPAIWSHLKESGNPECLCLVPLNGQPHRITLGCLWEGIFTPNTGIISLRVKPPGSQGRAFNMWIPLLCTVPPCGKRSSACSLSWRQTAHQCNQGPLRWHLGRASPVSTFPQWSGIWGSTGVQEERTDKMRQFSQRKEGKVTSPLLISWKAHGSRVLVFTLALTVTVTTIYYPPILCQNWVGAPHVLHDRLSVLTSQCLSQVPLVVLSILLGKKLRLREGRWQLS